MPHIHGFRPASPTSSHRSHHFSRASVNASIKHADEYFAACIPTCSPPSPQHPHQTLDCSRTPAVPLRRDSCSIRPLAPVKHPPLHPAHLASTRAQPSWAVIIVMQNFTVISQWTGAAPALYSVSAQCHQRQSDSQASLTLIFSTASPDANDSTETFQQRPPGFDESLSGAVPALAVSKR